MLCQEIEELLSSYIDKELSEEQARLVEAHLSGCADCAQTLAVLKQVAAELGALPPLEMPADTQDRLAAAIDRRLSGARATGAGQTAAPWWRWFTRPAFYSTAGAFAVLVFAVALWQAPGQKSADLEAPTLQGAPQADAPANKKHGGSEAYRSFTRGELDDMARAATAPKDRAGLEGSDRRESRTAPADSPKLLLDAYEKDATSALDAQTAARTAAADKPAKIISATLGVFEERAAWVVVIELEDRPGNYRAAAVDADSGRLLYSTGN